MKHLLISFTTAFLLLYSYSSIAQESDTVNQLDANGKKTGFWIEYSTQSAKNSGLANNRKMREGYYLEGRKNGVWTYFHEDGKTPRLIGYFELNRPKGAYKKFYKSGSIKESGQFAGYKQKGALIRYNENGLVYLLSYYDSNGKAVRSDFYDIKGKITSREIFLPDNKIREMRWDKTGKLLLDTTFVKNNFYAKDKAKRTIPKTENIEVHSPGKVGDIEYNKNGDIIISGESKEDKIWNGYLFEYDPKNLLKSVTYYKDGKKIGNENY